MRKKKWARPELAQCPYYLSWPEDMRGRWRMAFPRQGELVLELGCGKGVGTARMGYEHPEMAIMAVDLSDDVLGDARRQVEQVYDRPVDNLKLVKLDISDIEAYVSPEDRVDRIMIPFCNPWPRHRHAKRRLTHPRQLLQYREILRDKGEIWFKTDDDPLYLFTLQAMEACGFEAVCLLDDLSASGFQPNYITEHEQRFMAQGLPIRFGIFRKRPGQYRPDPLLWGLKDTEGEKICDP